jgi:hypothetical protein
MGTVEWLPTTTSWVEFRPLLAYHISTCIPSYQVLHKVVTDRLSIFDGTIFFLKIECNYGIHPILRWVETNNGFEDFEKTRGDTGSA